MERNASNDGGAHLIDTPANSLPLDQLPGVGHESDGVADHNDDADVDPHPGHHHIFPANVTLKVVLYFETLLLKIKEIKAKGV